MVVGRRPAGTAATTLRRGRPRPVEVGVLRPRRTFVRGASSLSRRAASECRPRRVTAPVNSPARRLPSTTQPRSGSANLDVRIVAGVRARAELREAPGSREARRAARVGDALELDAHGSATSASARIRSSVAAVTKISAADRAPLHARREVYGGADHRVLRALLGAMLRRPLARVDADAHLEAGQPRAAVTDSAPPSPPASPARPPRRARRGPLGRAGRRRREIASPMNSLIVRPCAMTMSPSARDSRSGPPSPTRGPPARRSACTAQVDMRTVTTRLWPPSRSPSGDSSSVFATLYGVAAEGVARIGCRRRHHLVEGAGELPTSSRERTAAPAKVPRRDARDAARERADRRVRRRARAGEEQRPRKPRPADDVKMALSSSRSGRSRGPPRSRGSAQPPSARGCPRSARPP